MSRQFDEFMEGHFDFHGDDQCIISPSNATELAKAYEVKANIELLISELLHDEDSSNLEKLLQEQKDEIENYIDALGEFDNSILASTIEYLCKQVGMRVGELEDTLKISSGYISRTIGENSKKKMSIDLLWKISQLFGVSISTMIERKMDTEQLNTNEQFILDIIGKLISDCESGRMSWTRETPKEMESCTDSDGCAGHILMRDTEYTDIGESGYPEVVGEGREFNSRFFSDNYHTKMLGNCYNAVLPETRITVYLAYISHENLGFVPDVQYELYTYTRSDGKLTPVCGSASVKEEVATALERLYKIVDDANANISMPGELRDAFKFYLQQ